MEEGADLYCFLSKPNIAPKPHSVGCVQRDGCLLLVRVKVLCLLKSNEKELVVLPNKNLPRSSSYDRS